MTFFMKDHVKSGVPNGTPKTLIPSDGVLNWDGVWKSGGRLKRDHVTYLQGWIETPIAHIVWSENVHMQMM